MSLMNIVTDFIDIKTYCQDTTLYYIHFYFFFTLELITLIYGGSTQKNNLHYLYCSNYFTYVIWIKNK